MRLVPLENSHSQLSNGTSLVKNGSILRKLWTNPVDMFSLTKYVPI